jgi:parallel beta-helix repeat protein
MKNKLIQLITFSILLYAASPCWATTYTVSNTNPSGAGSLDLAITNANGSSGVDTIVFSIDVSDANHYYYQDDSKDDSLTNAVTTSLDDGSITDFDPDYPISQHSWFRISPTSDLPNITDTVFINGYSQSGASENTVAMFRTSDAVLKIELDGTSVGAFTDGLNVIASGSVIKGLIINDFTDDGIQCAANNVTIAGCYIGTDPTGALDEGNSYEGINFLGDNTYFNMVIGGSTPAERNVISGNGYNGIYMEDAWKNVIRGNYVGVDVTGTVDLGNTYDGISVYDADTNSIINNLVSGNSHNGIKLSNEADYVVVKGNRIGTDADGLAAIANSYSGIDLNLWVLYDTIGGVNASDRNIISGNTQNGIRIYNSSDSNVVLGNYIGVDSTGVGALPNESNGVLIEFGSEGNTIGGTGAGEGNVIAHNGGGGIVLDWATYNLLVGNSIHSNTSQGIDLEADGVTTNDAGDGDFGDNDLQNFPVIDSTLSDGSSTVVVFGSLNSTSSSSFTLHFYSSSAADPSGHGEGETYVGDTTVTTNGLGDVTFTKTLSAAMAVGQVFSATATDSDNNTSEFSDTSLVTAMPPFEVTSTTDVADGDTTSISSLVMSKGADGEISLREAISACNNTAGPDTINFNIPDALVGGVHTITPSSALPGIIDTILIDGTSEPDFTSSPIIELNGTSAGAVDGLTLAAGSDSSTIRSLVINRFEGNGITINSSHGNTIAGNYIGLDSTGAVDQGNASRGVRLTNSANNTIGGVTSADRNLISGNGSRGVYIEGVASSGNVVCGNYIGLDVTGTLDRGNSGSGVKIVGAPNNTIGGATAATRNVISGNSGRGVHIDSSGAMGNAVTGNYIGTDLTGILDVGNTFSGVYISDADSNTIGGTTAGLRNVIASNGAYGVYISGVTSEGNVVAGNYIGADVTGAVDLGNSSRGVYILNAPGNIIGGSTAAARNIISGNNNRGVYIDGANASGNVVSANYIGVDVSGALDLGNSFSGVKIVDAPNNIIGGSTAGERNVISGNGATGVHIDLSGATGNVVKGNYIGSDSTGTIDLGNSFDGVLITDASDNTIGGLAAGEGNLIAYNVHDGIAVTGSVTGNAFLGNAVHSNTANGIDLNDDGVTTNDAGDGDTGPNDMQNFPVLDSTLSDGSSTVVVYGSLNSTASGSFDLYFYSNSAADASGYGEGETYVGDTTVTTDGSGDVTFSKTFSTAIAIGQIFTVTATNALGSTSEFSDTSLVTSSIVVSVSVGDPTFAFGTALLNTWQTAQTSLITNDGTVAETFVGQISQYTDGGNNWTISDAANGVDQIRAQWSITSDTGPWTDITAYDSDFTIATNVATSGNETLWLRIQTPTSTTSYTEYSSTLTVTALEF